MLERFARLEVYSYSGEVTGEGVDGKKLHKLLDLEIDEITSDSNEFTSFPRPTTSLSALLANRAFGSNEPRLKKIQRFIETLPNSVQCREALSHIFSNKLHSLHPVPLTESSEDDFLMKRVSMVSTVSDLGRSIRKVVGARFSPVLNEELLSSVRGDRLYLMVVAATPFLRCIEGAPSNPFTVSLLLTLKALERLPVLALRVRLQIVAFFCDTPEFVLLDETVLPNFSGRILEGTPDYKPPPKEECRASELSPQNPTVTVHTHPTNSTSTSFSMLKALYVHTGLNEADTAFLEEVVRSLIQQRQRVADMEGGGTASTSMRDVIKNLFRLGRFRDNVVTLTEFLEASKQTGKRPPIPPGKEFLFALIERDVRERAKSGGLSDYADSTSASSGVSPVRVLKRRSESSDHASKKDRD
uniref:Uncharacterized protein n=1 Tax=Chromera velia CCMP2878 TaxID=1169474 RepID=A0A0G4H9R2_9ALVE|eukprot:Cvel_25458.t1-p1 / transcript=Cvel_25458.t1 / gene=Cvel_25458 / organism=Chromera_velia_CCMP2878 / gene_product=hypothetical protein / transcript_product=hypothetical protein / location=Cvel_scaffold2887:10314-11552(+) / protein_length=413 / sequence_SO=supercontig / SO=protein_coding / is_pseudo=false